MSALNDCLSFHTIMPPRLQQYNMEYYRVCCCAKRSPTFLWCSTLWSEHTFLLFIPRLVAYGQHKSAKYHSLIGEYNCRNSQTVKVCDQIVKFSL